MEAKLDPSDTDLRRLQRAVDCLASVVALRPAWAGASASHVSRSLIDTLFGALRLALVYVRLDRHGEDGSIQEARTALNMSAGRVDAALRRRLGKDSSRWPRSASGRVGAEALSMATVPLELAGETGVLVAASGRPDFPTASEALVLDVSAGQLLLAWHDGQRLKQRDRRAPDMASLFTPQAELDHAARAMSLGVLTASIAHEVNQPLSGVITNASTCLRMLGADPPNLEGALETARRTIRDGHRASEIVARLRTLFGKKELAVEPVDLNAAAREVLTLTRHELQRHRIALRVRLDEDLPEVIGDQVQLQQVILNLLLNASDATRNVDDRPRRISVETAREAGAVRVTVRDTGPGVQPDSLGKLFDAFFTTKAGGMGIGLSVSRSIVERHGGRLWATTNDGPGATFAFSIPCAPCPRSDRR